MDTDELKDAICDLRYLLDRGYRHKAALDVVANRYRLPAERRNFLVRAVFSRDEAKANKKKLLGIDKIGGREIAVDGYNVLIGVEESLRGGEVFLCDDGFVRDARGTFGRYRFSKYTDHAIDEILRLLAGHSVGKAVFVFDSQVSRSGELAARFRTRMAELGVEGEAIAVPNADHVIGKHELACSSDRAIIKKVNKVIDLVSYIAKDVKRLPDCTGGGA
ncbi:MAG: DUF434 domain-containing protein [Candidatus Hydrothermarchaeaceae archaeon]